MFSVSSMCFSCGSKKKLSTGVLELCICKNCQLVLNFCCHLLFYYSNIYHWPLLENCHGILIKDCLVFSNWFSRQMITNWVECLHHSMHHNEYYLPDLDNSLCNAINSALSSNIMGFASWLILLQNSIDVKKLTCSPFLSSCAYKINFLDKFDPNEFSRFFHLHSSKGKTPPTKPIPLGIHCWNAFSSADWWEGHLQTLCRGLQEGWE